VSRVNVAGEIWQFVGVIWGGVSPLVSLRDPSGRVTSMTAKQWTNAGAKF
jgi:hypothetical protein